MAVLQTRSIPVLEGLFLPTAYRIPPTMATAGRHHPTYVATPRRTHPYSIGIGPGPFAFPYPSSVVLTPGPIALVDSGLYSPMNKYTLSMLKNRAGTPLQLRNRSHTTSSNSRCPSFCSSTYSWG